VRRERVPSLVREQERGLEPELERAERALERVPERALETVVLQ